MSCKRYIGSLTGLLCLCSFIGIAAADGFQVPRLRGPVVDQGGFLSASSERQIAAALMAVKRQGGTEIAVLTVKSLGGLTIEQASIQVAEQWQLGSADKDNGVLLMFAKQERRARIEVGQGLEGHLPDAHAKRIIDETIVPMFRAGNTEQGILLGVYQVAGRTNPELNLQQIFGAQRTAQHQRGSGRRGSGFGALIPLVFILLFIFGGRGGRRGRGGMAGGLLTGLFLGSMMGGGRRYRSGGFGGGGFGGGGFGGGGGGFSGGGASGGW